MDFLKIPYGDCHLIWSTLAIFQAPAIGDTNMTDALES
jgi:hypothetical protein